ncbi:GNAT family N-acetyltransferase [Aquipuribacter sp. MA13-6]|uniref:GNAT family N-acetyltransferase n=1 Tax=unclassified Aquipuribacter TaxID=2635084 RepID=UPI003EEA7FDE
MHLPEPVRATLRDCDDETVRAVYEDLLAPVFRPEELLSPEELRTAYGTGGRSPSTVLLAGGRPLAVMLGEWFQDRRVLLLSYLSVSDAARGSGLGTTLLTEDLPTWWGDAPAPLVLAEVDDPAVWPSEAMGGDPQARLRFYGRHGASLAPLPYVQPSLQGSSARVDGMLLLRLGEAEGEVAGLADFLREYFVACEGPGALDDPEVLGLLELAARHDEQGEWWDVARWPEVRGTGAAAEEVTP